MADIVRGVLGLTLKELRKSIGQGAASSAGGMAFKLALGLLGVDVGTDGKLQEIQNAITALSKQLDSISNELKDFELSTASYFAGEHIARIETRYLEYSRALLELAKYAKDHTSKAEGAMKSYHDKARDSLVEIGNRIRDELGSSLLCIHYLLVGNTGTVGLFMLARRADLPNSKGLMNHYVYMRQIFLRYWAVQMKAITLMQWINEPQSGVNFIGSDSGSTKGPISIALDHLKDQENIFRATIGANVLDLACTFVKHTSVGPSGAIFQKG